MQHFARSAIAVAVSTALALGATSAARAQSTEVDEEIIVYGTQGSTESYSGS